MKLELYCCLDLLRRAKDMSGLKLPIPGLPGEFIVHHMGIQNDKMIFFWKVKPQFLHKYEMNMCPKLNLINKGTWKELKLIQRRIQSSYQNISSSGCWKECTLTAEKQISFTVGRGSQLKFTREIVHFSGCGLSALQSCFCKLISVSTEL